MTDKRRWAAADVNRDGLLTIEEYNCFVHPVDKPHMRETIISVSRPFLYANRIYPCRQSCHSELSGMLFARLDFSRL